MYKAVCLHCDKTVSFESRSAAPAECPYCFEDLTSATIISEAPEDAGEVSMLTLIYQINQQRIEIPAAQKIVLGRNSFGANVLSNIFFNGKQVVSRKHCSIEFRDNKFYLQDEGSLNGTYYGVNKVECKDAPQVIENESLIYLGEEPFLAQIQFKSAENRAQDDAPKAEPAVKKYRCNEPICRYESEKFSSVCPECSTYNSLIEVQE